VSWHYLQGQEVASWEENSLDGAPSALLNMLPTREACCLRDSVTGTCHGSLYGTTCGPSTADRGAAWLMLSPAGSPAPTSATAATSSGWPESAADSGETWPASLVKFDPASCSWKTSQRSLFEEWEAYSATWPRSGLMHGGTCWELPTLAGLSRESGCGSWPTLKASDAKQFSKNFAYFERRVKVASDLPVMVGLKTPPTPNGFYGRLNPAWTEWLMGWPIGWTASEPLAMDKIHEWWQTHGGCCAEPSNV
jgi:hypothetical protein